MRPSLSQIVGLLATALILKVTASVVWGYRDYFPPDFDSAFLHGREERFWHGYQWAFYVHIVSGPWSLVLGLLLMSDRLRKRFSKLHQQLGRLHVLNVLLLVTPSGIWMATDAETGPLAGFGFASLGAATALCGALGWRSAVERRFAAHRRWMSRCFVLLCSAVVLRLLGGAFTTLGVSGDWTYVLAAWGSWLVPLAAFEFIRPRWMAHANV